MRFEPAEIRDTFLILIFLIVGAILVLKEQSVAGGWVLSAAVIAFIAQVGTRFKR